MTFNSASEIILFKVNNTSELNMVKDNLLLLAACNIVVHMTQSLVQDMKQVGREHFRNLAKRVNAHNEKMGWNFSLSAGHVWKPSTETQHYSTSLYRDLAKKWQWVTHDRYTLSTFKNVQGRQAKNELQRPYKGQQHIQYPQQYNQREEWLEIDPRDNWNQPHKGVSYEPTRRQIESYMRQYMDENKQVPQLSSEDIDEAKTRKILDVTEQICRMYKSQEVTDEDKYISGLLDPHNASPASLRVPGHYNRKTFAFTTYDSINFTVGNNEQYAFFVFSPGNLTLPPMSLHILPVNNILTFPAVNVNIGVETVNQTVQLPTAIQTSGALTRVLTTEVNEKIAQASMVRLVSAGGYIEKVSKSENEAGMVIATTTTYPAVGATNLAQVFNQSKGTRDYAEIPIANVENEIMNWIYMPQDEDDTSEFVVPYQANIWVNHGFYDQLFDDFGDDRQIWHEGAIQTAHVYVMTGDENPQTWDPAPPQTHLAQGSGYYFLPSILGKHNVIGYIDNASVGSQYRFVIKRHFEGIAGHDQYFYHHKESSLIKYGSVGELLSTYKHPDADLEEIYQGWGLRALPLLWEGGKIAYNYIKSKPKRREQFRSLIKQFASSMGRKFGLGEGTINDIGHYIDKIGAMRRRESQNQDKNQKRGLVVQPHLISITPAKIQGRNSNRSTTGGFVKLVQSSNDLIDNIKFNSQQQSERTFYEQQSNQRLNTEEEKNDLGQKIGRNTLDMSPLTQLMKPQAKTTKKTPDN